jgi:hypothetical protein
VVLYFHKLEQHKMPDTHKEFSGSWLMWAAGVLFVSLSLVPAFLALSLFLSHTPVLRTSLLSLFVAVLCHHTAAARHGTAWRGVARAVKMLCNQFPNPNLNPNANHNLRTRRD